MPLSQSSHKHVDLGSEHVVFGRPAPAQPVPMQASSLRALVLSGLSSESIVRFAAARQSSPQIGSRWRWTAGTSLGRQRPAARPFDRTPGPKRRAEIPCCGRETQCWVLRRRELMLCESFARACRRGAALPPPRRAKTQDSTSMKSCV